MIIWTIISTIIIGAIVGALGRLVAPGRQRIPWWLTILVGIVAAWIGTAIAAAFGVASTGGIDWIRWIITVIVAAVLVALVAGIWGKSKSRSDAS